MYPICCPQMTGILLSTGLPSWPWQRAQAPSFSAMLCAIAGLGLALDKAARIAPQEINRRNATYGFTLRTLKKSGAQPAPLPQSLRNLACSFERKSDDVVAALEVDLNVAARANHDVLLAAH